MQKIFTLLLFALLVYPLTAQDVAGGCDGIRYISEPFTEIAVNTVVFGGNINSTGQFQTLEMDIYQPVGDTVSKRPIILWAFGGGFVGGDRSDMEETCREFARRGFVTAAFDYRLYSITQGIPDTLGTMDVIVKAMHDMKAAIRFFREDAATDNLYRIDPDRVMAGGISAGGITALHAAYLDAADDIPDYFMDILEDNGGLEGNSGDPDNMLYSSDIQFVISLSGALYTRDWIDASEAPLLSIHGTEDEIVPYGHGFLSFTFGVVFNFNSVDGSGALHPVMDDFGMNNFHVAVPGGFHEDTYTDPAYEVYRETFTVEGALMIYDFLCPDIPIVVVEVEEPVAESIPVNIYPNPATEFVQVEVPATAGPYSVDVLDLTGRQLAAWENLRPEEMLSLRGIPKGCYLLHLRGDNWQRTEKLFIR